MAKPIGGKWYFVTVSHIPLRDFQTEKLENSIMHITSYTWDCFYHSACRMHLYPSFPISSLMVFVNHRVVTAMKPSIQGSRAHTEAGSLLIAS